MNHSMSIRVERNGKFIDRIHYHQSTSILDLMRICLRFLKNYPRLKQMVQWGTTIIISFGHTPPPPRTGEEHAFLNSCARHNLTGKQAEALLYRSKGMMIKEIAALLCVTNGCVSQHISNALRILKVKTVKEAVELLTGRQQKCPSGQLSLFPDIL